MIRHGGLFILFPSLARLGVLGMSGDLPPDMC